MAGRLKRGDREPMLTIASVAERLGVHPQTVRRYIAQGHIAALKLPSGDRRIEAHELKRFIASMDA